MQAFKQTLAIALFFTLAANVTSFSQGIQSYYDSHKNDEGMESGIVPPKLASLVLDEEYAEAKDVLRSLRSLKYLNYWGEREKISSYSDRAVKSINQHELLLEEEDQGRRVKVFGTEKKGKIKHVLVVVETKAQFILMIAKGKLTKKQLASLPDLSKEIQ